MKSISIFLFQGMSPSISLGLAWMSIEEEAALDYADTDNGDTPASSGPILQGSRNNTMSRFAVRVLKRYGDTDKAKVLVREYGEELKYSLATGYICYDGQFWMNYEIVQRVIAQIPFEK